MRRAAKIDINQPELVRQLRSIPGCTVQPLHDVGGGVPDLAVGWMGVNYFLEIKNNSLPPSKRRLTSDEKRWHSKWAGQVAIVETFEDCLNVLGIGTEAAPF